MNNVLKSKNFYESIFGDLDSVKGSDADPKHLIETCPDIPEIYMACGFDDFLFDKCEDFYNFLCEKNISSTFIRDEGEHSWEFCDKHIKEFIKNII